MKMLNSIRLFALVLAMIFFTQISQAQRLYGTAGLNEGFVAPLVLSGGIYVVGTSNGNATVSSIASNLSHIWTKEFPVANGETIFLNDIKESHSNNLIVAGTSSAGPGNTNMHLFVAEINKTTGAVLQGRRLSIPGNNRLLNVKIIQAGADPDCPTCSGNYFVVARRTDVNSNVPQHPWLTKLDYGLNTVWSKTYHDGTHTENYTMIAGIGTNSGGAIIGGVTSQNNIMGYFLEVDCDGNKVAYSGYKTPSSEFLYISNVIREFGSSGNLIFCGGVKPTGNNNYQGFIAKANSSLNYFQGTWYDDPSDYETFFVGLTQKPSTNGSVYVADIASVGVNFEPRIFRTSNANLLTSTKSYRDFGPNIPCCQISYPIVMNGTGKLVLTDGRPGVAPLGMNDAFLYQVPATLSDACATSTTATFSSLQVNTFPNLAITIATVQPTSNPHCLQNPLPWVATTLPCPPYGNLNDPTNERGRLELPQNNQMSDYFGAQAESRNAPTQQSASVQKLGFEMFPNPANESVEIILSDAESTAGQPLQIIDLNGKVLKTQPLDGEVSEVLLDVSDLPKGIYLVKIGDAAVQKLTKM